VQDSSAAAYIGELDSEPTRASAPITNDAGVVQISPGAGAVDLTQPAAGYPNSPDRYQPSGSPNFARTVPSDEVVVDAAAEWTSELGAKRAEVVSDGSAFQNLAASEFKSAAGEHGVQIVTTPSADSGETARYDTGTEQIAFPTGLYALSAQLDPSKLQEPEFVPGFQRRFHRAPGPSAAYGYEAMGVVLQAIGAAGTDASSFRDKVPNAVFGMHRDGTVLGSYGINSEGDTTECMIQRYRVKTSIRVPLAAPCPTR